MREMTSVGICRLDRRGLERQRAAGQALRVRVTGLLVIAGDVSPGLAAEVIASIVLRGPLVAGPAVRQALAGRISRP
jgi:hypothetical protein